MGALEMLVVFNSIHGAGASVVGFVVLHRGHKIMLSFQEGAHWPWTARCHVEDPDASLPRLASLGLSPVEALDACADAVERDDDDDDPPEWLRPDVGRRGGETRKHTASAPLESSIQVTGTVHMVGAIKIIDEDGEERLFTGALLKLTPEALRAMGSLLYSEVVVTQVRCATGGDQ